MRTERIMLFRAASELRMKYRANKTGFKPVSDPPLPTPYSPPQFFSYWPFQGILLLLCLCVCSFICGVCIAFICSSSGHVRPAMSQISLHVRTVWSESLSFVWRNFASLAIQNAPSEESDQTTRRLIWIVAGCICLKIWFGSNMYVPFGKASKG